jgi:glutamate--cysteine ligase
VLGECEPIAAALDEACGGNAHGRVLAAARGALGDPESLASARVLHEAEHNHGKSFPGFALTQSLRHRSALLELPLAANVEARFARLAKESVAAQRELEAADTVPFETYRQQYLAQDLMSGAHFRSTGS